MAATEVVGRLLGEGPPVAVTIADGRIAGVAPARAGDEAERFVLAPAFVDLQTNGRWGVSFSDESLTVDQVVEVVRAHAALGTARLLPTLISAGRDATLHGLRTIAAACDQVPEVGAMVQGIHLEGPYLSEADGYRGAHPVEAIRDPDPAEFAAFQAAAGGRVALMTLAPERHGSIAFIRAAVAGGVRIALGHTAADGSTLRAAAEAGASLSTHLGNGIAAQLARHPNPIWDQAACDGLSASLIADGAHIGPELIRVLARVKGPERMILVSDFSPLAGCPPGLYGPWEVLDDGRIRVAGTTYLAGANEPLDVGLTNLVRATGWSLPQALATVTNNPCRLLGRAVPSIAVGQPANLVRLRVEPDASQVPTLKLAGTWVDGRYHAPVA